VSGADLARRAAAQARRLGAELLTTQEVIRVRADDELYRVVTLGDGAELVCAALVIATGVSVHQLEAPGVERLNGAGVYYGAALAEARCYQGQQVFVVGGANSAGQAALFFSRYASKVTMVVRGASLQKGMSRYLVDQIKGTPHIEVLPRTEVLEVHGEDRLEAVTLIERDTGASRKLPAAALFIFIGAVPRTEMVAGLVERNESGFILTGPDLLRDGRRPRHWKPKRDPFLLESSVPGIFAAGDVRQGVVRRVASAVGEGAIAVSSVHQYLKTV
jgi:thioredoxin reductase (NADPH)